MAEQKIDPNDLDEIDRAANGHTLIPLTYDLGSQEYKVDFKAIEPQEEQDLLGRPVEKTVEQQSSIMSEEQQLEVFKARVVDNLRAAVQADAYVQVDKGNERG